ncbi:phytoene desaturase family protein [Tautonia sp. JC769]|uniref:phytoene desaturase family protein n=1 Tax=Tautonia sp. JC769 TaxID=3232135 RepID=UPI00345B09BA
MAGSHVVVIGGGVGGLSSALELARRGLRVTLLERHADLGGKASERREAGFRWDEGPSIVVMPWVYRELFAQAGLDPDRYLPMTRLDPAFRVVFPDGRRLDLPADEPGLRDAFASIDPVDADALGPFLDRLDRFAAKIGHAYCDRLLESWPQVLTSPLMSSAMIISPFQQYAAEVDRTFRSGPIRELLYGFPTYSGFNPITAPASLLVIPWTIIREGVWYPASGGIAAIPRAIAAACRDLGVEIHTGVEAEAIELDASGRVRGVATSHGPVPCNVVVSNSDYVHTHRLLRGGRGFSPEVDTIRQGKVEPSGSFFTVQLGCNRTWDLSAHHLLVLTEGSGRVYDEVYDRGEFPSDPPLYVNVTSATDPGDAPEGGSNPFVVIGAPAMPDESASDPDFEQRYADRLIDRLERAGMHGLADATVSRKVTGPAEFSRKFHAFRGAIYGLSSKHNILGGGFRPLNYRADVPGLYFVGGGVQPGAGLPMAVQSGKIAAGRIAKDLGVRGRHRPATTRPETR